MYQLHTDSQPSIKKQRTIWVRIQNENILKTALLFVWMELKQEMIAEKLPSVFKDLFCKYVYNKIGMIYENWISMILQWNIMIVLFVPFRMAVNSDSFI